MAEEYIIETRRLKNRETENRRYIQRAGQPETKSEIDPKGVLHPAYSKFYAIITKAHKSIIKKANLEKVTTSFEI